MKQKSTIGSNKLWHEHWQAHPHHQKFQWLILLFCTLFFGTAILFSLSGNKLFSLASKAALTKVRPGVNGDAVISGSVGGSPLTVKTTNSYAGAINSITFRGKEYIDTANGGRLIQSALQEDGYGECLNPTEAANIVNAPSTLRSIFTRGNMLTTTTQMMYWLRPGDTSPVCGTATQAVNTAQLSNDKVTKTVTIGHRELPNVIEYKTVFNLPDFHKEALFAPVAGFLKAEFSKFYVYDTSSQRAVPFAMRDGVLEQGKVPIISTPDGNHAMAIYSPTLPEYFGLGYSMGRFTSALTSGTPTNQLGCTERRYALSSGEYAFTCFVVIGTVSEVEHALASLHSLYAETNRLPGGSVDGLTGTKLCGWALDPDAPHQSIAVHVYADAPYPQGRLIGYIDKADLPRPDINNFTGYAGNHGYCYEVPQAYLNGSVQQVYVYAIDAMGGQNNVLANSPFKLPFAQQGR